MAVDPFDDARPTDTDFVGEPSVGAQVHLRAIKTILKNWRDRIAFKDITNIFTKAQAVMSAGLSASANPQIDASLSNQFTITLTTNATFSKPLNLSPNQQFLLVIRQDVTGGRSYTFTSDYKFPSGIKPPPTLAAGSIDLVSCFWTGATANDASGLLLCNYVQNMK